MNDEYQREPLVHEEQGVVYLFSRYWEKLKERGKNKDIMAIIDRIKNPKVQFPDLSYCTKEGKLGGIEFKFKKSDFWNDYGKRLPKFRKIEHYEDYDNKLPLIVVYWVDDAQFNDNIEKSLRRYNVLFINLSEEFDYVAEKGKFGISAFLKFKNKSKTKDNQKLYSYEQIKYGIKKMGKKGIKTIEPNRKYIKILGHDSKGGADDIDIRHWKTVRIYTTTGSNKFKKNWLPCRIFFRPKDDGKIVGYLAPKYLILINDKTRNKNVLKKFYSEYYFSNFKPFEYEDGYCIIYDKFKFLEENEGKRLLTLLEKAHGKWQTKGWAIEKDDEKELFKKLMSF